MIVPVVDFAMLLAESDAVEWALVVEFLVGGALGFGVVWVITRNARRVARQNASELVEVAKREAAVAAQEVKQRRHHDRGTGRRENDIAPGQKVGLQKIKQSDGNECAVEAEQSRPHVGPSDPKEYRGRCAGERSNQNCTTKKHRVVENAHQK